MTREGHERRSKHCEVVGASNSSRAPSAQPKQLAKHRRPSNLGEDSSPEDSPPRGAAPSTPKEFECLKMRPSEVFTDREVMNYNKFESSRVAELRQKSCYTKTKERGTDECF
jgi:hypothetical protein